MSGVGRVLRTYVFPILVSIAALICAIWFSLPVRVIGAAVDDAPIGWYVEVTVDRVQQIPWVFKDQDRRTTARFALGWIGQRALLIQAAPGLPFEKRMRGELHQLAGRPRTWVNETPQLGAVCYDVTLELTDPDLRRVEGLAGIVVSLGMLGFWLYRLYRWRRPHAIIADPKSAIGPRLDTERPRPDDLVSAVLWRHGVARFVAPFLLYVLCVMLIPAVSAAEYLGFELTDNTSAARLFALFSLSFAITAPISGLPFFWWVRRRRAEIRRVVRNGEIVGGVIVSTTAWGTRGMFGLSSRLNASHTNLDVATSLGESTRYFRVVVDGGPAWAVPGARVPMLISSEERFGIIIAPDGKDFEARVRRRWGRRDAGRGGRGLPTARVLNVHGRGEHCAVSGGHAGARSGDGDGAPSA